MHYTLPCQQQSVARMKASPFVLALVLCPHWNSSRCSHLLLRNLKDRLYSIKGPGSRYVLHSFTALAENPSEPDQNRHGVTQGMGRIILSQLSWWPGSREIEKLRVRVLVLRQGFDKRGGVITRNFSFSTSLRWPTHLRNFVDKSKFLHFLEQIP